MQRIREGLRTRSAGGADDKNTQEMSQQLQQAVEIAYSSTAEPALKKQALEYVQNVKAGACLLYTSRCV